MLKAFTASMFLSLGSVLEEAERNGTDTSVIIIIIIFNFWCFFPKYFSLNLGISKLLSPSLLFGQHDGKA